MFHSYLYHGKSKGLSSKIAWPIIASLVRGMMVVNKPQNVVTGWCEAPPPCCDPCRENYGKCSSNWLMTAHRDLPREKRRTGNFRRIAIPTQKKCFNIVLTKKVLKVFEFSIFPKLHFSKNVTCHFFSGQITKKNKNEQNNKMCSASPNKVFQKPTDSPTARKDKNQKAVIYKTRCLHFLPNVLLWKLTWTLQNDGFQQESPFAGVYFQGHVSF